MEKPGPAPSLVSFAGLPDRQVSVHFGKHFAAGRPGCERAATPRSSTSESAMKEHIIDIPKQTIRTPSRFYLARVGATMLFPDDESSRHRYEESELALVACEWQICEAQQLPEIVQWSMREMATTSATRFAQGFQAGFVLHEALGGKRLGLCGSSKAEIVGRLISDLKLDPKKRFDRFSSKTFANVVWPLFRPVAHFWAATFVAMKRDREPFPCALTSFKDYLAGVEAF
jgi:hypothetical protein